MAIAPNQLRIVLLGVTLICSISNATAQTDPSEKASTPTTGTISGRVVNESGQPLSHASVFVSAPIGPTQARNVMTDDGGNFTITGLDPYAYYLSAVAPSYINMPRDPDVPSPTYRVGDSVTIIMLKGAVLTGTVTNAAGDPVVQVGVRALMVRDANGQEPIAARFPIERTTDDRGVYRLYGLPPGTYVVSAGGRSGGFGSDLYETNAPTYAPGATRDTASEITVRPGDEISGVDIHYRGDVGHAISGSIINPPTNNASLNISLYQLVHGVRQMAASAFQFQNTSGFSFFGLADGDYELMAQSNSAQGEFLMSEPQRLSLRGADISGLKLGLKSLAFISGNVALENSAATECANKHKPVFSETMIVATRERRANDSEVGPGYILGQTLLDNKGDFVLRNLVPGQFTLSARFFAKYWYLRSIQSSSVTAQAAARGTDLARSGLALKFGDRVSGVTVTLAEGAASLRGTVKLEAKQSVPAKLYVHLFPAEKESADDVLRFFTAPVASDASFSLNNIAPGKYWLVTRVVTDNESTTDLKLRSPQRADTRAQLRGSAVAIGTPLELKPCQNLTSFELPLKLSTKP